MSHVPFREPEALSSAENLLASWIGLDPGTIGSAAIARAVQTRQNALGLTDPEAVVARARIDPAERDRLVEAVIVAESWFFRDPQVFAFVCRFAATRAVLRGHTPVRILSAPCAGGEEPYSLAMGLLEAGLAPDRFTIDAWDISHVALARAREARYSANAFRNADVSFRDRWFRREGPASVLDERVRRQVTFSWGNLLDDSFLAEALVPGRGPYDIVFCRNLLIYLTPAARSSLTAKLEQLVMADGLLVLGAAEPPILRGGWIPAGDSSVFALRRGVRATRSDRPGAIAPGRERRPAAGPSAPRAAAGGTAPAMPPAPTLDDVLRRAGELANSRQFAAALALCETHARQAGPTPQLFFLMGILHQAAGDADRAEGCFHKTLYLDATHDEALLSLALLATQRGDTAMAEHYRQSAARMLARQAPP